MDGTPIGAGVAVAERAPSRATGLVEAFLELSKARLSLMVVLTAAAGYWLAAREGVSWPHLALTLAGTTLAAFGANALNQVVEAERDGRMRRTARRPLPAGLLSRRTATTFAVSAGVAGPLILAVWVNTLTAALALSCLLIYVLVYTPLKTRTALNTLVGAVCGAIPPMMGWTAVTGEVSAPAWILGGILFVWQLPHFYALAWLYREDYARGGFRMLPAVDASGRLTQVAVLATAAALVPVSLALTLVGATGWVYLLGAAMLGGGLLGVSTVLFRELTLVNARGVFAATIIYLALLMLLMTLDRAPAQV